jgi:hypothetical protein
VKPTIAVAGSIAQRPHKGGHTWVFLQYLLGFRRLGFDVVFIDRLEPEMCVGAHGEPVAVEQSLNLRYLRDVMHDFGFTNQWALLHDHGREVIGMSRRDLLDRISRADLLINVMGFLDDDELLAAVPIRVFLDIDPGFGQMWCALGLHDLFRGHDVHVTIGEAIGQEDCTIPTCSIDWITTKQPVALDHWPVAMSPGRAVTSISSWRGPFGPIEFEGHTYGLRVHEFRRFVDLPRHVDVDLEVALDIDAVEVEDVRRLREGGWRLREPASVAGDPHAYKRYIAESRAELMIAKNLYVDSHSGWFSDRSICYLASGRPVLAQDTGLSPFLPAGEGVVLFSSFDDAVAGVQSIESDYERHARAAREMAEEHFSSDVVLPRLLDAIGGHA